MSLRLTGEGLVLREWTEDDLAVMVELFDDADVAHRTPRVSPFDLAAARDHLVRVRTDHDRVHLAITTDGGQAKGEVLLNKSNDSLGYIVGSAHRGQRLAARAVRVMTGYAHEVAALPTVILEIEPDNGPSIAVARAAGFRLSPKPPFLVVDKGRCVTLQTWAHDLGT